MTEQELRLKAFEIALSTLGVEGGPTQRRWLHELADEIVRYANNEPNPEPEPAPTRVFETRADLTPEQVIKLNNYLNPTKESRRRRGW